MQKKDTRINRAFLFLFLLLQFLWEVAGVNDSTRWCILYYSSWYTLAFYSFMMLAKDTEKPLWIDIYRAIGSMWLFYIGLEVSYWNETYEIYRHKPGQWVYNFAIAFVLPFAVFTIVHAIKWQKKKSTDGLANKRPI